MTEITIIVCTYDRPAMLAVELESIVASAATVPDAVRIIVVDDASPTDDAKWIAKRHGVEYLRRSENGGVARTIVSGFEKVDSPYFAIWGDDDFMLPSWFSRHLKRIREGFDVVSGSYWRADGNLHPKRRMILRPVTLGALLRNEVSANDGSLVRTAALNGIPWRPERERAMVMTMWLALASAGKTFSAIAEPTWLYRRHPGQLSYRPSEHFMELRRASIAEYSVPAWVENFG